MPGIIEYKKCLLASLLLAFSVTNPVPVQAQVHSFTDTGITTYLLASKQPITLEKAVEKTKQETGGRILTAETVDKDGRRVHRLKVLLPGGSVKIIYVEAE